MRATLPSGVTKTLHVIASPAPEAGPSGHFVRGTVQDITSQRETEEQIQKLLTDKEVLLNEVHHRIKNNMNTMVAMLKLQSSMLVDSEARSVLEEAAGRFRSMELLYERLYRGGPSIDENVSSYLEGLAHEIVHGFPHVGSISIDSAIEPFTVGPKTLSVLGIILNELVVNSLKHAFVDRTEGTISVTIRRNGDRIRLEIADDGSGLPQEIDPVASSGFGLQAVTALVDQIKGAIEFRRNNGTRVTIEFDEEQQ